MEIGYHSALQNSLNHAIPALNAFTHREVTALSLALAACSGALGPWGPGSLGLWGPGALRLWSPAALRPWGSAALGLWGPGALAPWGSAALQLCGSGALRLCGSVQATASYTSLAQKVRWQLWWLVGSDHAPLCGYPNLFGNMYVIE